SDVGSPRTPPQSPVNAPRSLRRRIQPFSKSGSSADEYSRGVLRRRRPLLKGCSRKNLGQFGLTDWLREVRIEAGFLCLPTILRLSIPRDGYQQHGIPPGGGPYRPGNGITVEIRQAKVHEDDLWA